MIHRFHVFAFAALGGVALVTLDARLATLQANDANNCLKGRGDIRIESCSRIIKSGRLFGLPVGNKSLAVAHGSRGIAYNNKGDYARAIADFNQSIELNPAETITFLNRGLAYVSKGDYTRAIADFGQSIKLDPKFARAYIARGQAYRNKGDYTRAIADFDQSISLRPKSAQAYGNRGAVYIDIGQSDKAVADYRKALELDPANERFRERLMRLGVTP